MKKEQLYIWLINHPGFGSVEVEAQNKLHALLAAAAAWKQRWTVIAKDCRVERLRKKARR